MSVNLIFDGSGVNIGKAIYKSSATFGNRNIKETESDFFDLESENTRLEVEYGQFSTGTGFLLSDVSGSIIFNGDLEGGSLDSVMIRNAGSNDLYYGLNSTDIDINKGGAYLPTGAVIQVITTIDYVWAIASSGGGSTIIHVNGPYQRQYGAWDY